MRLENERYGILRKVSTKFTTTRNKPDFSDPETQNRMLDIGYPTRNSTPFETHEEWVNAWFRLADQKKAEIQSELQPNNEEITIELAISHVTYNHNFVRFCLTLTPQLFTCEENTVRLIYWRQGKYIEIEQFVFDTITYKGFSIGRKVLEIIEDFCKKRRVTRIYLLAEFRATNFYTKCGYTKTGGGGYEKILI